MPTKNGDSPIDSDASLIEPTRISDITPTATPASASISTALRTRPRLALVLLGRVGRVEEVAVGPEREHQPGEVGDQQHDRHGDREVLDVAAEVDFAFSSGPGSPPPCTSWKIAGIASAAAASSSMSACTLAAVRSNVWRSRLRPPTQHRGAHHEQDVAEDRADQRGLDDLLQPLVQREQGDDDLGRVAEGDVEEAADARARSASRAARSPAPSAPRSGSPRARSRRRSRSRRRARARARSRSG